MEATTEIKRVLKEILGANPNLPIHGSIVSIENDTCSVKLASGLVLSDVRLAANISDLENKFLIIPKIDSEVILLSQTGELSGLMVVKVSEVEKLIYKLDDFEFVLDGTTKKATLKNANANLGLLLDNLITTIATAQIITPAGPGTISPTTIAQLNQLKVQFKSLLNGI